MPFPLKRSLFLFCLVAFIGVALVSYHPLDPSYNNASDANVQNWLGLAGAYVADPILQFLGLGSVVALVVFGAWLLRLTLERQLRQAYMRMAALLVAVVACSILFDVMAFTPETWPFYVGLGGFVGGLVAAPLVALTTPIATGLVASLIGFVAFLVACAVTWSEWCRAMRAVMRVLRISWRVCVTVSQLVVAFVRNHIVARLSKGAVQRVELRNEVRDVAEEEADDLVDMQAKAPKPRKKIAKQASLKFDSDGFELPNLQFLAQAKHLKYNTLTESSLSQNAKLLEQVLEEFGVKGKITKVRPGPVVTLYELEPAAGTKSSRVIGLSDDIARSMSAVSTRIAVIPGKNAIGIELPNISRETVFLRELLETEDYQDERIKLPIALGKDIGGDTVISDLSRMPHLLIAGTTGSGKSVAVNTMILSFLYRMSPDECKFIMIDPKMLELSVYEGIPHLLTPVVTEPGKAVVALKWAVKEMENRYRLMSNLGVRNVAGYNKRIAEARAKGEVLERNVQTGFDPGTGVPIMERVPLEMQELPFIVVIVDEMADLMLVAGKDIESSIQRLAQMARAAGIHLIMATQRPSVDVITGVVKANFPTRISFQVTSKIDSRTILGEQGAEQLLGMGDMLYMSGGSRVTRVHGPFVDDAEVEKIVKYLKKQGKPNYIEEVTKADDEDDDSLTGGGSNTGDELYDKAVNVVLRDRKASTSYVQRQLKIGYNRAANLIEKMEKEGVISAANHVGKREVLVE